MDTQAKWDKMGHLLFLYSCAQCYSLRNGGSGDENDFSSHLQSSKIPESKYISCSLCFFFSPFSVGYTLSPRFPIPSTFCGVFCHDFSIPVYTFPGLITHKTSIIHYLRPYFNTVGVVLAQDSVGMFLRLNS